MQVHIESGNNLPADSGPWTPFKSVEMFKGYPVPRIGVEESEVLAAIKSQGFYLTTDREVAQRLIGE
jgi:hypothetical protein